MADPLPGPPHPLSLHINYLLARDMLYAVPYDIAAHHVHCSRAAAEELRISVLQLLQAWVILHLPRRIRLCRAVPDGLVASTPTPRHQWSPRLAGPIPLQEIESIVITMAPDWPRTFR